ncbi:unnamed protein product [Clonostachys byssicola]|uniref:N-acetylglucosaminylphosphatidylinositol deacetylase n=1 Tax=Clonostachys byssicola TaxID=160290 RepID=A0A9N9U2Z7_9HYPO|nr:unnamed protein product [Clonostachys byssicola]
MIAPSLLALGAASLLIALCLRMANIPAPTQLHNKTIALLIAHPDDEAMFFAPTVLALSRKETGNRVKILCLSSGDAEGLGETRKKELVKSGLLLGLKSESDVMVIDNPALFPDSMTTHWDTDEISTLLRTTFMTSESSSGSPKPTIDVLITFDSKGISSHPNHISLFHGARAFISSLTQPGSGVDRTVSLYTLTTVGVARKYAGVFDRLFTPLLVRGGMGSHGQVMPSSLVFMHGLGQGGWRTAREAMTAAHVSQMRLFRYGWITLSRYMFINTLEMEEVK